MKLNISYVHKTTGTRLKMTSTDMYVMSHMNTVCIWNEIQLSNLIHLPVAVIAVIFLINTVF